MAHMEITTRIGCRVACSYCPQTTVVGEYRDRSSEQVMSLDVFKTCVNKMPQAVKIHFTGFAEPFLNPLCSDMILYAHERNRTIQVSTTLVGLTPEIVKSVEHVPFDLFNVHLPSEDSSEEIIPVTEEYLSTLCALDDSRIPVAYHCIGARVHPRVAEGRDIRFIVPHDRAGNVDEEGAVKLRVRRLKKAVRQFQNKRSPDDKANGSQTEDQVQTLLKVLSNEEIEGAEEAETRKPLKRGAIRCAKDLRENVLLPNGDVSACCNDYGLEHVFGNLVEQDYESLFKSSEYKRLEELQRNDSGDLLCRRDCKYARGVTVVSKVLENKFVYNLKHTRSVGDVVLLAKRAAREAKKKLLKS